MTAVEIAPEATEATEVEFGIDRLIRDVIEETDLVDPRDIARVVAHRVPAGEVRNVMTSLLHMQVRKRLRDARRDAILGVRDPQNQSGRSRWDHAATLLGSHVCVEGTWKLLGECTPKDVADLLFEYKERARVMLEHGAQYKRLLDVMQQARVATVAELGEETVKAIFDA